MFNNKIFVAGHNGMVGAALLRGLKQNRFKNIILRDRKNLDLTDQKMVDDFFLSQRPEVVIIAAAKVGGIFANNQYRAEFLYNNLMIESNLINISYKYGVKKLIFLGSSCIYPKYSDQPMKEESILTGKLEFTNEPYSIAKIVGIKLCENYYRQYGCNFYSLMPANLYGYNDYFDIENSHVIPALIRRMHEAKMNNTREFVVWGSGKPTREFLFVDDLADAILFSMNNIEANDLYSNGISHLNIGTGIEVHIKQLAEIIKKIIGFKGEIVFDASKPEGMPRRLLDVSRMKNLGWKHSTELEHGLELTYEWFLENINKIRT